MSRRNLGTRSHPTKKSFVALAICAFVIANFYALFLFTTGANHGPNSNDPNYSIRPIQNPHITSSSPSLQHGNVNITEADLLLGACLRFDGKSQHISYRELFGSWDFKTSNRSDHDSLNLATRTTLSFGIVSRALDEVQENISSHVQSSAADWGIENIDTSFNKLPPMMFAPPMSNPAHCVQDLLFTLLPMVYRGDLKGVRGVTAHRPKEDYCVKVLSALEWFDGIHTIPDNTCFDELWVPAFMHYRFPRGRSRGVEFDNSNGYLHNEDLPIEMMRFFQKEMWRGLLSPNPEPELEEHFIILFESRKGRGRREWRNVDEVANAVRQEIGSDFVRIEVVDDVAMLPLNEQAALYHRASILITPHGGSNANNVFMKPNSTVFEISCLGGSWAREWLIDLGIMHQEVIADDPPCSDHNEKFLSVKPEALVETIVRAFTDATGLKKEIDILEPSYLSISESSAYYRSCPIRFQFGDKTDHDRIPDVTTWLNRSGLCKASTTFLIGGLNEGQFAMTMLDACPSATLHGVEIQPDVFEKVKSSLSHYPNATAHNGGWSDKPGELYIAGTGQTARLVDKPDPQSSSRRIKVETLLRFARDLGIDQALYTLIDTEGHEPAVIKGMNLEEESNRKLFPVFQFEVGSGWDQLSKLHWNQHETALHLEQAGYELYLIGKLYYWRVPAAFFERGVGAINTKPRCNTNYETDEQMFVWGNVLAIHPTLAPKGLVDVVRESALKHASIVRSS